MKRFPSLSSSIRFNACQVYIPLLILMGSIIFFGWHVVGYLQVRRSMDFFEQERNSTRLGDEESDDLDDKESSDTENDDNSDEEDSFTVVNREPDYLKKRAISFARKYNLGESVQKLYSAGSQGSHDTSPSSEGTRPQKKVRPKKSRKSGKKPINQSYTRTFTAVDPRFNLPIDRDSFWLSSPFGPRRRSGGKREFHGGIDMAAVRGTPVKAAGDGVVVQAGPQPGYGNVVVIRHADDFKTRYAHLSKILISQGATVKVGQVIGKVGATGNARASGKTRDASHLHFEVEKQGKRVNPYYFFK